MSKHSAVHSWWHNCGIMAFPEQCSTEAGAVTCKRCLAAIKKNPNGLRPAFVPGSLSAAAPAMLEALDMVAALPGFEPEETYGMAVLAAIARARGSE